MTDPARSRTMARIRAADTLPELGLRRELRRIGLTGYRLQRRDLPGRPDLAFVGPRVAVFVHGCFWHGCPQHYREPRTNVPFWRGKVARNRRRDGEALHRLAEMRWLAVVVWEHEDAAVAAERVQGALAVAALMAEGRP